MTIGHDGWMAQRSYIYKNKVQCLLKFSPLKFLAELLSGADHQDLSLACSLRTPESCFYGCDSLHELL